MSIKLRMNEISKSGEKSLKKTEFPYCDKITEGTVFDPSEDRTQQHFKAECNINNILLKYQKTGIIEVPDKDPIYGDFSNLPDYQDMQNAIIRANEAFMALPSNLRKRFDNNPAEFIKFVENAENREEAEKLGLLRPKAEPDTAEKTLDVLNKIQKGLEKTE